jgi:excisionase family DNA binding protein
MPTLVSTSLNHDILAVTAADRRDAVGAQHTRDTMSDARLSFTAPNGPTIELPQRVNTLLLDILDKIALGRAVSVRTLPDQLSTTVAADILGVSRPTLMRLIRAGKLPAHKVGSHTRVQRHDLFALKRLRLRKQVAAFEELRRLEDGDD